MLARMNWDVVCMHRVAVTELPLAVPPRQDNSNSEADNNDDDYSCSGACRERTRALR